MTSARTVMTIVMASIMTKMHLEQGEQQQPEGDRYDCRNEGA